MFLKKNVIGYELFSFFSLKQSGSGEAGHVKAGEAQEVASGPETEQQIAFGSQAFFGRKK